jgi:ATP-dependent Clp protease, protease subunit
MEFSFGNVIDAIEERLCESAVKSFGDLVSAKAAIQNREIYIGDIEYNTGADTDALIRYWNREDEKNNIPVDQRDPIKLFINSCGGDLTETFIMIDAIKLSKTPVWTICSGCAYSGGFLTFIAGHRRIAYPSASFMFHEGATNSGGIDAGKFRNYADFYNVQLDQIKDIVLAQTEISEDYYKEHQKDDLWLTAKQAIELGACDEIAEDLM